MPIPNLLLCGWIVSTEGNFNCSIMGLSSILSHNRCYILRPLMTALLSIAGFYQQVSLLIIAEEQICESQSIRKYLVEVRQQML